MRVIIIIIITIIIKKGTQWLLVRKRTIPAELPPFVAKYLLRVESVPWPVQRFPTAVNLGILDQRF
jgi:hypothetical protein